METAKHKRKIVGGFVCRRSKKLMKIRSSGNKVNGSVVRNRNRVPCTFRVRSISGTESANRQRRQIPVSETRISICVMYVVSIPSDEKFLASDKSSRTGTWPAWNTYFRCGLARLIVENTPAIPSRSISTVRRLAANCSRKFRDDRGCCFADEFHEFELRTSCLVPLIPVRDSIRPICSITLGHV